jgi:hypothetical protein
MRFTLFVLLLLVCIYGNAQFSLAVQGGYNNSSLNQPKGGVFNPRDYSAGKGWQGSLRAQYGYKHWFAYAGMGLNNYTLGFGSFTFESSYNATYHPLYLQIPAGIGYNAKIYKSLRASLFAGAYLQYGIGGNETSHSQSWLPGPMRLNPQTAKIIYGGTGTDFPSNLARTNTGAQMGAGLQCQKVQLQATYCAGLSNILPAGSTYNLRLNTFALNVGYKILGK